MRRGAAVAIAAAALGMSADPQWLELSRAANAAARAGDYVKLREALIALAPLIPASPRNTYNLAAADAKLGNRDAAIAGLRRFAAMGAVQNAAADEDFASIKSAPEFAAILARMEESRKPVTRSVEVAAIAEPDLIAEDLAYDAQSRRWLVSSVRKSKIVTADGKLFASTPWAAFALAIDPRRLALWATTGWVAQCESCAAADKDKSALLEFDLDTGSLRRRIESPVPGVLGDMTIGRRGDLYVSEGQRGAVLRLRAGAAAFERLDVPGEFGSPQTPALSKDERTLYVPDYRRGVAAIDLKTRAVTWIVPAAEVALTGIDGLYLRGEWFVAVQNGFAPPRVARIGRDFKRHETVEANWAGLGEPTHGTFADGVFYFLANTGWDAYDAQGKRRQGAGPVQSAIRKLSRD